jgi:hypothetical protein
MRLRLNSSSHVSYQSSSLGDCEDLRKERMTMSTLKKASVLLAVAVAMSATTAFAQRDAGAKMRGEFGTGFWAPSTPTYRWTPTYVAPAPVITTTAPATQAPQVASAPTVRRSFSVEPSAGAPAAACVVPPSSVAQRAPGVRRSFSYEPAPPAYYIAPPAGVTRGGTRMPSYMLPKTDARRYGA